MLSEARIQYIADSSKYFSNPTVYINGTDYYDMLDVFILEFDLIKAARNSADKKFTTRNKWADFGRRIATINMISVKNY